MKSIQGEEHMRLKRPRWWIVGIIAGSLLILAFICIAYWFGWAWTGFGPETSAPKQHAKTLWDWMQLLIIPVVLALAAFLFNFATTRTEREIATQRYQHDQEMAADKQKEELLQTYLDRMSELLLNNHLRTSTDPKDEVRYIARARTLTVLSRLDSSRKRSLLQFLHESDLISTKEGSIIQLKGADLSGANLSHADLSGANLVDAVVTQEQLALVRNKPGKTV
jgi:Pentapeptide repeats (8 copies)